MRGFFAKCEARLAESRRNFRCFSTIILSAAAVAAAAMCIPEFRGTFFIEIESRDIRVGEMRYHGYRSREVTPKPVLNSERRIF
jgi:hypothetical protein